MHLQNTEIHVHVFIKVSLLYIVTIRTKNVIEISYHSTKPLSKSFFKLISLCILFGSAFISSLMSYCHNTGNDKFSVLVLISAVISVYRLSVHNLAAI